MGLYLTLAWRNIWRNKRRSIIAISSILFAVVIALATRSMQLGSYKRMIANSVSFYTGYIQIHTAGYWEKRSLDQTFIASDSLLSAVARVKNVTLAAPRRESFALASAGNLSNGTLFLGVDPEKEDQLTSLKKRVVAGEYLEENDQGVLMAEGLAQELHLSVGDTVVFISQGYHGMTAAGKYPVRGLVKFPTPDLNNRMTCLSLPAAQTFFSAPGRVTSLAVMIPDQDLLPATVAALKQQFDSDYEVMGWNELIPELVNAIEFDNSQGIIMLIVIYMVVGFGILGTVLMMTLERMREFGMLIAVGMNRARLRLVVALETLFLSLFGVVCGTIVGFPVILYYYYHPIRFSGDYEKYMLEYGLEPVMPFALDPSIFGFQALAVLVIALLVAIYPVWRIGKIEPTTALRTG